jgi:hypothetical protein
VTGLARDLAQDRVSTVGVEDIVRLFIEAFPRNLLSLLSKLPDLFFFWFLCDGLLMTLQTSPDVWHSGEGLRLKIAVAGVALQPLFEVLLMVEGDWLLSFGAKTKTEEEKKHERPGRQSNEEKFHAMNPWVNTGLSKESPVPFKMG